ncbi:hypothetical protein BBJ28_00007607 [Nothophytophthora sp. Chile5]|nr:hypothetical protein BBJ28_00007607 [Nothophytophthora sp. Chile5]
MSDRGSSPRGGSERSRSRSPSPQEGAKAATAGEGDASPARQEGGDARRGSRSRSHSPAPAAGKGPAVDAEVANPGNNLYVANLPHRVSGRDGGWTLLEEMFAKFGRVDKCEVIVDPVTRESSCCFMFQLALNLLCAACCLMADLGPKMASSKYGRDMPRERFGGDRSRDRDRRRSRSRSRDRGGYSRRHDDRDRGRYDDRDRGRGGYDRDRYDDGRRSRR